MLEKRFKQDKNYILREAQIDLQDQLLSETVAIAVTNFERLENPLGLEDDFIRSLKQQQRVHVDFLSGPYQLLADTYRFLNPDNQLTFVWDGNSQYTKYAKDWSDAYRAWQHELAAYPSFSRLIIKGALFGSETNNVFLEKELSRIIKGHFKVKRSKTGLITKAA